MPAEECRFVSSGTLDRITLVHVAQMLLDKRGYSGAWSESVKQALWDRADIVQTANLPIERFFDPVFAMTLRYEGTRSNLLAALQRANGELRHKLMVQGQGR